MLNTLLHKLFRRSPEKVISSTKKAIQNFDKKKEGWYKGGIFSNSVLKMKLEKGQRSDTIIFYIYEKSITNMLKHYKKIISQRKEIKMVKNELTTLPTTKKFKLKVFKKKEWRKQIKSLARPMARLEQDYQKLDRSLYEYIIKNAKELLNSFEYDNEQIDQIRKEFYPRVEKTKKNNQETLEYLKNLDDNKQYYEFYKYMKDTYKHNFLWRFDEGNTKLALNNDMRDGIYQEEPRRIEDKGNLVWELSLRKKGMKERFFFINTTIHKYKELLPLFLERNERTHEDIKNFVISFYRSFDKVKITLKDAEEDFYLRRKIYQKIKKLTRLMVKHTAGADVKELREQGYYVMHGIYPNTEKGIGRAPINKFRRDFHSETNEGFTWLEALKKLLTIKDILICGYLWKPGIEFQTYGPIGVIVGKGKVIGGAGASLVATPRMRDITQFAIAKDDAGNFDIDWQGIKREIHIRVRDIDGIYIVPNKIKGKEGKIKFDSRIYPKIIEFLETKKFNYYKYNGSDFQIIPKEEALSYLSPEVASD